MPEGRCDNAPDVPDGLVVHPHAVVEYLDVGRRIVRLARIDADLDARRQGVVGVLDELHDGYDVAGHQVRAVCQLARGGSVGVGQGGLSGSCLDADGSDPRAAAHKDLVGWPKSRASNASRAPNAACFATGASI